MAFMIMSSPSKHEGVGGIQHRPMAESDRAFVFSSWLRSYASSPLAKALPEPVYMANQHALVERLVLQGCQVAHPEGDPATILGWICAAPGTLHYVYVKGDLRRAGIARALLAGLGPVAVYTHRTGLGEHLLRLIPGSQYNPAAAWSP